MAIGASLDLADHALARRRVEFRGVGEREPLLRRSGDDGGGQRMLAASFEAGGEPQQCVRIEARRRADGGHARLAFGQRAGLVDDQRVDLLEPLQRLGVLDQHAGLRAAPDADHDRHGRGQPQGAGAGDDQHRHGGDQAEGEARLGTERRPGDEGERGDRDDGRHEPARHRSARRWIGARASLRLGHHLDDLRQHRLAPDLVGAHDEAAGLVDRPADDPLAGGSCHRHRFAGDHGLVDGARSLDDLAVDRHFFAGPHAQPVADLDLSSGTSSSVPSARRRRAVLGARPSNARIAPPVRSRARNSSTCPSSTSTVMTAAASK